MPKKRSEPRSRATTAYASLTAGQISDMALSHAPRTPERHTLEELSGWLRTCENGATAEQMDGLALAIISALIVLEHAPLLAKDRERMQTKAEALAKARTPPETVAATHRMELAADRQRAKARRR